ncbi:MAG: cytochrome c peroxidase [Pseudomonadota bacterium]
MFHHRTSLRAILQSLALSATLGGAALANPYPQPLGPKGFHPFDERQAELGRLLFYDKILSGNRNISCGTCHHHDHASADGLPLGIGEGGHGVGPERVAAPGDNAIVKRVPRNSPAMFNLGHTSIKALFHDGRVSVSDLFGNEFNTPAEEWLPRGLDNVLAAQALFPMTAQAEMAGQPRENEVAGASNDRINYVWPILADRVRGVEGYRSGFVEAFEEVETPGDITIVHIADALSAFINAEWRSFDSPFDAYLEGDESALTAAQHRGKDLFFGQAGCAECHSGPLFSDQSFHALALPHYGPGRTRRFDPYARDVGRMAETDDLEDAYRFRTPMLRNVELTGPYGHNGAYATLEGIIRHHLDPQNSFDTWTPERVDLPEAPWLNAIDFVALSDSRERARIRAAVDITPRNLSDQDIDDLVAFLHGLTGTESVHGRLGRPETVPSRLPVDK